MAASTSGSVPSQLSSAFAAGVVGALALCGVAWLMAKMRIFSLLHCHISLPIGREWLYSRLVWGGIFGLFFVLPVWSGKTAKRGLLFGLLPSLFQLFVVFPLLLHKQVMGLNFGYTTPLFVVVLNLFWGLVTAGWLAMLG